jgi:hypothetical protein
VYGTTALCGPSSTYNTFWIDNGEVQTAPNVEAGTVALIANTYVATFTGGPNLTTLGIRPGDFFRVGNGSPQYFQILGVTSSNTLDIASSSINVSSPTTVSGADWAIFIGDGYAEMIAADNNIMEIDGGFWNANWGYGLRFMGEFGPHVYGGCQIQFNGSAGICIGVWPTIGSGLTGQAVLSTIIDHPYFESNYNNLDLVLGYASGIDVQQPVSLQGILAQSGTTGWAEDQAAMYGLGAGFNIDLQVNNLVNATAHASFGFEYDGEIFLTSAASSLQSFESYFEIFNTVGPLTLASQPTIPAPLLPEQNQFVIYINVSAYAITLNNNGNAGVASKLALRAATVTVQPGTSITFVYSTVQGLWYQIAP